MSRWYRAYEGTVTDAKFGEIALVAGCSRSVAIAAWHSILESCASCNEGGKFDVTPRRVAVILGEPVQMIEAVFAEMTLLGLLENDVVSAWTRRQFESDNSTQRSKKSREAKRNVAQPEVQQHCNDDATLQQRSATPPDTDTDTDTEDNKMDLRASAPVDPLPIANAPEPETTDLESRLREAAGTCLHPPSPNLMILSKPLAWLKAGCDLEADMLPAIRAAAARASPNSIKSWAYFDGPVMQAYANRTSPITKPEPRHATPHRKPNAIMDAFDKLDAQIARSRERGNRDTGGDGTVIDLPALAFR